LKRLNLAGCHGVSDAGVAELAGCCKQLTRLNLSRCERLGEFGDTALVALGRYCKELEELDLHGCRHVKDLGLKAIGQCHCLEVLRLTNCHEVTSDAVRALAKGCSALRDLSLSGCLKIKNRDLIVLAEACTSLQALDLSGCVEVRGKGLKSIVEQCPRLSTLNLSGCKNMDASALQHFVPNPSAKWAGCLTLSELYLQDCPRLTEASVRSVAHSCTKLFTLDITNCRQLGRRFVQQLLDELPFVDRAHEWVGFAPKPNAWALIAARDRELLENRSATQLQRCWRGLLSRRGLHAVRVARAAIFFVPLAQAKFRGLVARRRAAKAALLRVEARSTLRMQAAFRGHVGRKEAQRRRNIKVIQGSNDHAASVIQRTYRGHLHCRITRKIRGIKREQAMQQLRYEALLQLSATRLQNAWRAKQCRARVAALLAAIEANRARRALEWASAQRVQQVVRGHWGRRRARQRQEYVDLKALELHSTKVIQAGYRGLQGRAELQRRKQVARWDLEDRMVALVQRSWRAMRGRHLTALMKSLWKLREREAGQATRIARCWRGFVSRKFVRLVKARMEHTYLLQRSGLHIQRLYRGHRGRTAREVAVEVAKLRTTAAPLFEAKAEFEGLLTERNLQMARLKATLAEDVADEARLTEELDMALKIKSKFHDSARITGAPQVTGYGLRVTGYGLRVKG
jgi:hypothetical protein